MAKLTPKQEKFAAEYFATGNASEAYRKVYDVKKASAETIRKRAQELLKNGAIAGRIEELRSKVADKAIVTRGWVIEQLRFNAEVALGHRKVRKSVKRNDTVVDIEVTDRDAAAANASLKLLGQLPEVGLFDADGKTNVVVAPLGPQPVGDEYLQRIAARFGASAEKYTASQKDSTPPVPPATVNSPGGDHLAAICERFGAKVTR